VITVANSYLATVSSIILAGATPVLCDVESDTGLMSIESLERSVTEKTKAIIVVHLGGYAANLDEIIRFCSENGIKLIEDCAQAFGTVDENDVHVGNRSSIGVFSAHPLKNLAALGDAGFVITNSDEYDHWLRKARSHGSINRDDIEFPSINSRLDEIQAAVLNVKLKYFSELIAERRKKVLRYRKGISAVVSIPAIDSIQRASHHLLIVRVTRREEVIGEVIKRCGIELKVHYPVPYHRFTFQGGVKIYDSLENTDNRAASIVSLPLGRHISNDVIDGICGVITDYEGR